MVEHQGQQGCAQDLRGGGEIGGDEGDADGHGFLRRRVQNGDPVLPGEAEQPRSGVGEEQPQDVGRVDAP